MVPTDMLDEAVREYKIEGLIGNETIRIASVSGNAGEPGKLRIILNLEIDDRYVLRQYRGALPEANFAA
jgi:hypothetical protein